MADTITLKSEALPDLDDLLQCPVCYEIPTGQIYQCNEGHHVCGPCKTRLEVCPVCRSMFFGTRNFVMEELITKIRNLHAFKLAGRMAVATTDEHITSAQDAINGNSIDNNVRDGSASDDTRASTSSRAPAACKGLFRCLCCIPGQTERLPAARLLNHLRYFHADKLLEGKTEDGEYVQAWTFPPNRGRVVAAVRISDMGVFFFVLEINENVIYAWLSMAATPLVSHDFSYTLKISGADREVVFTDCVWSVRSCEGALKKRGRCLIARGSHAVALRSSSLTARLSVRRSPDDLSGRSPRSVVRVASRPPPNPAPQVAPPPAAPRLSRAARRRIERRIDEAVEAAVAGHTPPRSPSPPGLSRASRRRIERRIDEAVAAAVAGLAPPRSPTPPGLSRAARLRIDNHFDGLVTSHVAAPNPPTARHRRRR